MLGAIGRCLAGIGGVGFGKARIHLTAQDDPAEIRKLALAAESDEQIAQDKGQTSIFDILEQAT